MILASFSVWQNSLGKRYNGIVGEDEPKKKICKEKFVSLPNPYQSIHTWLAKMRSKRGYTREEFVESAIWSALDAKNAL